MEYFTWAIWAFTFVWTFGGLAMFAWLKWESNVRKAKVAAEKTKKLTVGFCKLALQAVAMMGIFIIPLVVTLLTWYFGP